MKSYNKYAGVFIYIITAVALLCIQGYQHKNIDFSFDIEDTSILSDFWYFSADGEKHEIEIPGTVPVDDEGSVTIYSTFPDELIEGGALRLRTAWQSISLKIGDVVLYEWGTNCDSSQEKALGSHWNVMRIPTDYSGEEFSVTIKSPFSAYTGMIQEIQYGTKSSLLFNILRTHGIDAMLSLIILIVGIIFAGTHFVFWKHDRKKYSLLHLAPFPIVIGIWSLGESQMLQFFTGSYALNSSFVFYALMLLPWAGILFTEKSIHTSNKWLLPLNKYFSLFQFMVMLLLITFNVYEPIEMIGVVNLTTFITIVNITGILLYEMIKYKNEVAKQNFMSLLILIIAGVIELLGFYFFQQFSLGIFMKIGILIYIVVIGKRSLLIIKTAIENSKESEYLEKLAYSDILTGGYNYTAYHRELDVIFEDENDENFQCEFWCILFDLNNLKRINDNHGHNVGDFAIRDAHAIMVQCFSKYGKIFRIGGDEFAAILPNCSKEEIEVQIEDMNLKIKAHNEQTEYDFSIAWGYDKFVGKSIEEFEEYFKVIDEKMYDRKNLQKV